MHQQQVTNRHIAKLLNSDEKNAYLHATQTKRLLTVPVDDHFFYQLVALCYFMGIEKFKQTPLLTMINHQMDKEWIRYMHEELVLHYTKYMYN